MTLAAGSRLGPYEILSPLEGLEVGEVYRANDPRLGRILAIKVLRLEATPDPEQLRGLEKESRWALELEHRNIVAVYDVGSANGVFYIAMERVEGATLRELLANGPLPIKRLLQIAPQIADGLAAAHEARILHRDLRPENVVVTKDGLVKIFDFGLANLTSAGSGDGEGSELPVKTGTAPSVVMGTVGYVSPEQASGAAVDFRSDQFSFGSILYEMATGKRAFAKKTPTDTLRAVLNEEPEPMTTVSPRTPTQLRWIVERCLAKDPRQRYSSTDDLARDLARLRDHLSQAISGVALSASSSRRRWIPGLIVLAGALAVASVSLLRGRPPAAKARAVRFSIDPPSDTDFGGGYHNFALSPDGSQLAFRANPHGGNPPGIWVRALSAAEARAVPGTENVDSLFWSPDGRSIGFFAAGKLLRVDVSGGAPIPICDVNANYSYSGSWGDGGEILFARFPGDAIHRVSTSEGKPTAIVKPDRARGEMTVSWPWFLPDGKSFIYLRQEEKGGTLMLSPPVVLSGRSSPMLSRAEYVEPGYLVFIREGMLLAQRFDTRTGKLSGEPVSISESVRYKLKEGFAAFATSRGGAVAFRTRDASRKRMGWFDRSGRAVDTLETLAPLGQPSDSNDVAIDPEGRRVLFDRAEPKTLTHHLWILDVDRKAEARVTSDPTDERSGLWLPDGKSIVYTAGGGGMVQLRRRDLTTGRAEALLPYGEDEQPGAVVSGGTQLTYMAVTDQGTSEMRFVSLSGDHKTSGLPQATAYGEAGGFSPDGRLILLASNASGRDELYVAPSASPGERIRVSSGGALHASGMWSRDGSEILYVSQEQRMISVPVRAAPSLSVGKPTVLFTTREDAAWDSFDVSPDGKRFLAVFTEGAPEPRPIEVILNWTAEASTQGSSAR